MTLAGRTLVYTPLACLALALASLSIGSSCAVAGSPPRTVVIDHRIGQVSLGEPEARITRAFGDPSPADFNHSKWLLYKHAGLYVAYAQIRPHRVFALATRSSEYRTSTGIRVGSTLKQLQRSTVVTCFPHDPIVCQHGYANDGPGTTFLASVATHRIVAIVISYGH